MSKEQAFKLNNGFSVSKFMEKIDIDFLYSYDVVNKVYKLLNNDLYGETQLSVIDELKENNRLVIIEIPTNIMKVYNIDEDEVFQAFIDMGKLK